MNIQTLKTILTDELGAEAADGGLKLPSGRKVTILVSFGDDTLRVQKVESVRITDQFVNLTSETEQFFVDTDADFAVKSEDSRAVSEGRPGFH